jgi:acyl-CoA synthetase (AMP-forming)/AMP-acid ligase II/acyl carrier protein
MEGTIGQTHLDYQQMGHIETSAIETHASFVEILQWRAQAQSERVAYAFTGLDDAPAQSMSYAQLDQRARALAVRLTERGLAGERVLLMCPPGRDYVAAFFGCLYAGAVAVPVYPPRPNRSLQRLVSIVEESGARAALTTISVRASILQGVNGVPQFEGVEWLAVEEESDGDAAGFIVPPTQAGQLAYLQYTSGSTSAPKGVMISHGNLIRNSALIHRSFATSAASRGVAWIPPYHDMGLVGALLQPLYAGFCATIMPPASFLQRPLRWLETISREGATISSGPNFAYDLCVRSVTPEQRNQLDLSRWSAALCGSEPVRAETLERFAEYFAPAGFRREAFFPCYGLAEATLLATSRMPSGRFTVRAFDTAALAAHNVHPAPKGTGRLLVSNGPVQVEQIEIVHPQTLQPCAPAEIGEVWIRDVSVAQGYWRREAETARSFRAQLADGTGPYLRTGDFGFLHEGELFVTGRMKELIILRGRNYYPQDIEPVAADSHPALQPGSVIAFGAERAGEERLVLVLELKRGARREPVEEITAAIRRAISEAFEIEADTIVLTPPLGVPKTSSGKLERQKCRQDYLNGTLRTVATAQQQRRAPTVLPKLSGTATQGVIEAWILARLAQVLEVEPASLDAGRPFSEFGLDSVMATGISGELENWLGRSLPATLLWDHPTAHALARHLAAPTPPVSAMHVPLTRVQPVRALPAVDLDDMQDDELAALLSRKLAAIREESLR